MARREALPSYILQLYSLAMNMRLADVRALASGVERLSMWLRRQAPMSVSATTFTALDRLQTEGPQRVSTLARAEHMTQPGVTILVNRLEELGYAERVPDPTDGRATLVRITVDGEAVLAERHAARAEVLRARIARLDAGDQRVLAAALPAIERLIALAPETPERQGKESR